MTGPLTRSDVLIWIFYGMFTFRDRWCDAGDDDKARLASRETVVGASTYQVVAQALSHRARLTVRVWPAPHRALAGKGPLEGSGWDSAREVAGPLDGAREEAEPPAGCGGRGAREVVGPPDESGWDGSCEMELHCPTGEMVADEVTGGSRKVLRLPEPGVYGVRASWRGRESTHEEVMRVIEDPEAVERTHGKEQFLFDMWLKGPLPPDDDDEEFEEELAL